MNDKIPNQVIWTAEDALVIKGTLDEFFDYNVVFDPLQKKAKVTIDVKDVVRINSCGVREWVKRMMVNKCRLTFIHCPPIFIDQATMIPQFLGRNAEVKSFFCTFVCDDCSQEEDFLLEVGKHIQRDQAHYDEPASETCPNCEKEMHFGHNHLIYFSFLNDKKAS